MDRLLRFCLLSLALYLLPADAADQKLGPGDSAPEFSLPGSDGVQYTLSELTREGPVVLAWFPMAFTSGCTIECRSLATNGPLLNAFDVQYFMASVDPLEENTRFADEMGADFALLSDADKQVAADYGVLYQNRFALRQTFYIGGDGKVLAVDRNVNPETSAEDMAATLERLGIPRRGAAKATD